MWSCWVHAVFLSQPALCPQFAVGMSTACELSTTSEALRLLCRDVTYQTASGLHVVLMKKLWQKMTGAGRSTMLQVLLCVPRLQKLCIVYCCILFDLSAYVYHIPQGMLCVVHSVIVMHSQRCSVMQTSNGQSLWGRVNLRPPKNSTMLTQVARLNDMSAHGLLL